MESRHSPARRMALLIGMLIVLGALSLAGLGAAGATPIRDEPVAPNLTTFTLQGRVCDGFPYDETRPLERVTVKLHGHPDDGYPDTGTVFITTTTGTDGRYSFTFYDDDVQGYEYLSIRETNPTGYDSVDATTMGGVKKSKDCIQFSLPLGGKNLTGNKFWDWSRSRPTPSPTPTITKTPVNTPTPTATSTGGPPVGTATPTPTATSTEYPPEFTPTPTLTGPAVTFPRGDWPQYAQEEISVHPEPPMAGRLTRLCAEVVNHDLANWHTATLEFRVAEFGICPTWAPVASVSVQVPPGSSAEGCAVWVPPNDGPWCIEVVLIQEGAEPQYSQRNIDQDEPLQPGEPHEMNFPVSNPLDHVADIILELAPHLQGWGVELSAVSLPGMGPGEVREVTLTVTPPAGEPLPPDGTVVVDAEAYADGQLIGGFRKVFRPPVPLHRFPDPPYAEGEITVHPYPVRAGEPAEVCVELYNPTADPQTVAVQFFWADFGIAIPFTPINGPRIVYLPPHSIVNECLFWIPPIGGNVCIQVELESEGYAPQRSQLNIDADEPLRPGEPHSITFPVHNPLDRTVDITLGLVPHLSNWGLELSQDVLPAMIPGEVREVTLTVTPPSGEPLPADATAIVDVEAYVEGELIGGFRKVFRPPIPLHRLPDPPYAEGEITVHPYPVRAGQPAEVCVELRNPTANPQSVTVHFSWANFGIGIPFSPINGPRIVHLPPHSIVRECIHWVPPVSGHVCIQVEVESDGYEPQSSQYNIDVDEPLQPGEPHSMTFQVGNPLDRVVDITLGLVPHLPNWGLELSPDTLLDVAPGQTRDVTLTVIPPADEPLPADGTVVVDVEAYVEGELIGGFRKTFRPPVSVHRPKDPVYAESEIGVDPYPIVTWQPVELSVELFNPTDTDQIVDARFSVAPFGIGLPFSEAHINPNPIQIFVPAHGAARGHVVWYPPPGMKGKFCVQVTLEAEGQEPVWSQRNVDVGEPLRPGEPHTLDFPVGSGSNTEPVTVTLGLVNHLGGWETSLSDYVLADVMPGNHITVSLTVTAPLEAQLGSGLPIVDVEAYTIEGEFLGGFRKLDVPPVSVHKLHEKGYAESEISVDPCPPQAGEETRVSAVLHNTSDVPVEVNVEFGWADFGMGIPFSNAGMVPPESLVTLPPATATSVDAVWTPTHSGHQCILVRLTDPEGRLEPQVSQRNVDVEELPPCGEEKVFTFTVYNDSSVTQTVDLGMITFNVPSDWEVTTDPSGTVDVGPYGEVEVRVIVWIPCPPDPPTPPIPPGAGAGAPTIDVEGYVDGELKGGIEIRFPREGPGFVVNLPMVVKRN